VLFPLTMPARPGKPGALGTLTRLAKAGGWSDRLLRALPWAYHEATALITAMEQAAAPSLRLQLQEARLARVLSAARQTPYGHGMPEGIGDWPLLDKPLLQALPQDFLAPGGWSIPASTSGATGTPLPLRRSLANVASEQAFLDHLLAPYGVSLRHGRVAVLRGDALKALDDRAPPFGRYRDRRWLTLSAPHLGRDTLSWFVTELERFRPDILWIYPTTGNTLAALLEECGTLLSIPVVFSSSEMLSPGTRQRLKAAFGGAVVDYYGQAERVCLAVHDKAGEGWFVPSYGAVELLPVPGSLSPDGQRREAEVVATGFWNLRMPLVRYRTGDRIAYPAQYGVDDLRAVALGCKPFLQVLGRESEYLVTSAGGRVTLYNLTRDFANVLQVQYLQRSLRHVEVRIVPAPSYVPADGRRLLEQARAMLGGTFTLTLETSKPLIRTARYKTPTVVRRLEDGAAAEAAPPAALATVFSA
jgi:phenylacetate-CoA ligase